MKLGRYAQSKLNAIRPGVKVFWWRHEDPRKRNFGDEITPLFIEKLFGKDCHWTRLADCQLIGAGSILDITFDHNPAGHRVDVWGSGFIEPGQAITSPDLVFHAVRGPLSAGRLPAKPTALGDPGLLASLVYKPSPATGKIGIVYHYDDANSSELHRLAENKNCRLISPLQPPEKVAEAISACRFVFSSSLHGLIFADSFNVPNQRFERSPLRGGDYKFNDYSLAVRQTESNKVTLSDIASLLSDKTAIDNMIDNFQPVTQLKDLQDGLLASFPYK